MTGRDCVKKSLFVALIMAFSLFKQPAVFAEAEDPRLGFEENAQPTQKSGIPEDLPGQAMQLNRVYGLFPEGCYPLCPADTDKKPSGTVQGPEAAGDEIGRMADLVQHDPAQPQHPSPAGPEIKSGGTAAAVSGQGTLSKKAGGGQDRKGNAEYLSDERKKAETRIRDLEALLNEARAEWEKDRDRSEKGISNLAGELQHVLTRLENAAGEKGMSAEGRGEILNFVRAASDYLRSENGEGLETDKNRYWHILEMNDLGFRETELKSWKTYLRKLDDLLAASDRNRTDGGGGKRTDQPPARSSDQVKKVISAESPAVKLEDLISQGRVFIDKLREESVRQEAMAQLRGELLTRVTAEMAAADGQLKSLDQERAAIREKLAREESGIDRRINNLKAVLNALQNEFNGLLAKGVARDEAVRGQIQDYCQRVRDYMEASRPGGLEAERHQYIESLTDRELGGVMDRYASWKKYAQLLGVYADVVQNAETLDELGYLANEFPFRQEAAERPARLADPPEWMSGKFIDEGRALMAKAVEPVPVHEIAGGETTRKGGGGGPVAPENENGR